MGKADKKADKIVKIARNMIMREATQAAVAAAVDCAGGMGVASITSCLVSWGVGGRDAAEIAELLRDIIEELGGTRQAKAFVRGKLQAAGISAKAARAIVG